jgi:patatin-related protein
MGTGLREKELRIALVCFGGVSLAVYMHGITKEILKLARASSAVHGITNRSERLTATFFDVRDASDPEYDTEAIYFDLLRDLGRAIELRVVVDILAGASAGGINSTMLSRALAHDLPMGKLRDLWLQNADVSVLLAPQAKARRWSKWFLRPFFWAAHAARLQLVKDREARSNLSLFMRSRWFQPPFDGLKMAELMYDGLAAMGKPRDPSSSLLPSGRGLDLFVTVTDFYGRQQLMQIHDPPIIHEREHRHVLHFKYRRHASGVVDSDFDLENAPALAFAARATSSIPGVFPPTQILEIDQLIHVRSVRWPRRKQFIAQNFARYARMNVDVASVPFIDGSVLNSRPFQAAIMAIRGRPAYREVDRRVVYIDPSPTRPGSPAYHRVPTFFPTLKGALSDIPLSEPVTDELKWISGFNERARRLRAIIESARPRISRLVAELIADGPNEAINESSIRAWREQADIKAARESGFAYEAYARLKLAAAQSFVTKLIIEVRGVHPASPFARAIAEVIEAWAIQSGATYQALCNRSPCAEGLTEGQSTPKWLAFLLAFDIDYRKRRLHFLIEGQNRLYQLLSSEVPDGLDPSAVDRLKRRFYQCLETLESRETAVSLNKASNNLIEDIFRSAPSPNEVKELTKYAQSFAARHKEQLNLLIEHIGSDIELETTTHDLDVLLAESNELPRGALHEVLVNYLGFPFWDVLTFPVMSGREAGEFNEIRVDRISPQDAKGVERLGDFRLKGTAMNQFAAFLSRAFRENDYLLGRLHAFDRLVDIVCDAAGFDFLNPGTVAALKRNGFVRILDAEEPHLLTCKAMIVELRAALDKRHGG